MTKVRTALLGDIADVNWGDTSVTKASYVESGFPAFSAAGSDGFLPYADFDRDAIVLSAIGARCGKTWFVSGKWSCIKNTIRYWSTNREVDNSYLYWATLGEDFWPKRGAAQPFITIGDARRLSIPVPPLAEQRRIAAILDQADALRAKRREALAQLDSLTQSIFIEMFGDPRTNKKKWNTANLGEVSIFFAGSTLPTGAVYTGQAGGYFLLKVSDMNLIGNEISFSICNEWSPVPGPAASTCPLGCIVFPKRGGAIGTNKKRLTTRSSVLDPNLMAIWPKPGALELPFLYQWFLGFDLGSIASGSSVPQLNKQDLAPLKIITPPTTLQREFANQIAVIERQKVLLGESSVQLDVLFSSLQHSAFRGEL